MASTCLLSLPLPRCSTLQLTWDKETQLRLKQCRGLPSLVLAQVPSVYTSVISQQAKVSIDSTRDCIT